MALAPKQYQTKKAKEDAKPLYQRRSTIKEGFETLKKELKSKPKKK